MSPHNTNNAIKSKEILEQKAVSTVSLKATIDEDKKSQEDNISDKPIVEINEAGKKILVFKDPLHSREKRSIINYTLYKGKWEFENLDGLDDEDPEKCGVKFTPLSDTTHFTIVFKSLKDRVEFMDSIYSDKEMKQTGNGVRLEDLANSKVLKTTGGFVGISLAGYGLYKLLNKLKTDIKII